jgi:pimeloyl-ACP methyl ester carboxylesterase
MKDIPLLLIHGYPFDHTMWFSTIASLGSKAKVIAPDLPGFGKSPVLSDKKPGMEAYAQFLIDHLDANKHDQVVIAGMSMGGYVALAFAEKFPDRLCGLGLISSQAAADTAEGKAARKDTIQKIRDKGISAVTEAIIPKLFANEKIASSDLRQYPEQGAEKAGGDGLIWALRAMADRPDRGHVLASLEIPVLVLHGSEDKIVPIEKARAMAAVCPKPIFVEVEGAGHATPLEAPDQVAAGLARLINACKEFVSSNP